MQFFESSETSLRNREISFSVCYIRRLFSATSIKLKTLQDKLRETCRQRAMRNILISVDLSLTLIVLP